MDDTQIRTNVHLVLAGAFLAGALFVLLEGRRTGMRNAWVYVVLASVVAFAFGFPLFLWARERHLASSAPA